MSLKIREQIIKVLLFSLLISVSMLMASVVEINFMLLILGFVIGFGVALFYIKRNKNILINMFLICFALLFGLTYKLEAMEYIIKLNL